jgi:hypothetical protein
VEEKTLLEIYSNAARVHLSIFDIGLTFGLVDPDASQEVNELVRVRMSPEHAKALLLILQKHIELYESEWREIYLPPELLQELNKKPSLVRVQKSDDDE